MLLKYTSSLSWEHIDLRKALRRSACPYRHRRAARPTEKRSSPARLKAGHEIDHGGPQPIRIRKSQYLNNRIEQDHRRIKRRIRPMLGFKALTTAAITLAGIEMIHIMRKRQGPFAVPYAQGQFEAIASEIRQVFGLSAVSKKFATQP